MSPSVHSCTIPVKERKKKQSAKTNVCSQVKGRKNAKGLDRILTNFFFNDKTIPFQVYAVMDFEDFDRMFSAYQKKEVGS